MKRSLRFAFQYDQLSLFKHVADMSGLYFRKAKMKAILLLLGLSVSVMAGDNEVSETKHCQCDTVYRYISLQVLIDAIISFRRTF